MAHTDDRQLMVSPQPGSADLRAPPRFAIPTSIRCNNRRTALIVCGVAAFLVFGVVIVFVGVYLFRRHRGSAGPTSIAITPFCCPDEVEWLARYVNTTALPCKNFFAYVCPEVTEGALSRYTIERYRPLHAVITGAMSADVPMGPVGRFLITYFRTCVRAIAHYDDFVSSLANAFLRDARDLLGKASAREAMIFCATVSMRYFLSSVINIHIDNNTVSLQFTADVCGVRGRYRVTLTAAVEAMRGTTNVTVTLNDMVKLVTALCNFFLGGA
ncbi:hypothetical protein MRX96_014874 [Rhipicephalus microplus]